MAASIYIYLDPSSSKRYAVKDDTVHLCGLSTMYKALPYKEYEPLNSAICSFSHFLWTVAILIVPVFQQWPLQKLSCWLWMIRQIGICGWESLSWKIPLKQIWLSCKYIHVQTVKWAHTVSPKCCVIEKDGKFKTCSFWRDDHQEIINSFHFENEDN
jgi:hypothetical protein